MGASLRCKTRSAGSNSQGLRFGTQTGSFTLGHLYLTGFRATGKTSVARQLSSLLKMPMIDLDERIRLSSGKTIAEIFSEVGEPGFRDLEAAALVSVAEEQPAIVSLGGGTVLREANRSLIRATGRCIWLTAEVSTIVTRLDADGRTKSQRPALTKLAPEAEIRWLLAEREGFYVQAADFRVATDNRTIDEIVEEVAGLL